MIRMRGSVLNTRCSDTTSFPLSLLRVLRVYPLLFCLLLFHVGLLLGVQPAAQASGPPSIASGSAPSSPVIETLPPAPSKSVYGIVDVGDGLSAYMATMEGLFASRDGGRTWRELSTGVASALTGQKQVFGIAVHPGDPQILLMGNREGLWRSEDGGTTWIRVGIQLSTSLVGLSLSFCRSSPDVVYMGTNEYGVFRSPDGGLTWSGGDKGLPREADGRRAATIHSLLADPADSNVAYAAASLYGLFKTLDGGQTWQEINKGLPVPLAWHTYPPRITVSPVTPQTLYLALGVPYHSHLTVTQIYRSTNGGESWRQIAELPEPNISIDLLTLDPRDPNMLQLRAGEKLFKVPVAVPTESGKGKP